MHKTTGGYLNQRTSLIRKGFQAHTTLLERPVGPVDLEALNAIQATPWAINARVLEVMYEGWTAGLPLAGMVEATLNELPDLVAPEVYEAMSSDDRRQVARVRAAIRESNDSASGRQRAFTDCVNVALELVDQAAIYYPHSRCFRGRVHPVPTSGPNPQGNDNAKALLMFARGVPLGLDGFRWLAIRLANCCGQDKLPLDARVQWVMERANLIIATAVAPLENLWWCAVTPEGKSVHDDPWSALATIFELAEALQMEDWSTFVSYLPVPLDGSCSGIQHLSAMGLDPVGANATNMSNSGVRQDVYMQVANTVIAQVSKDAAEGNEVAQAWVGHVTRKTAKRAVMTTPYGVSKGGIRKQLILDGLVPKTDMEGKLADYMRDALIDGLEHTVVSAKLVMGWLQDTARALAEAGIAFDFPTPSGSVVRQCYRELDDERIVTLVGTLQTQGIKPNAALSVSKSATAAAPNVIHSCDASHLVLTTVAGKREGIEDWAMIHDSFGTHAGNTTTLARVLREQFILMYSGDWLATIRDFVLGYAPDVELPELPPRGTFDLSQVMDAPFFFS